MTETAAVSDSALHGILRAAEWIVPPGMTAKGTSLEAYRGPLHWASLSTRYSVDGVIIRATGQLQVSAECEAKEHVLMLHLPELGVLGLSGLGLPVYLRGVAPGVSRQPMLALDEEREAYLDRDIRSANLTGEEKQKLRDEFVLDPSSWGYIPIGEYRVVGRELGAAAPGR